MATVFRQKLMLGCGCELLIAGRGVHTFGASRALVSFAASA